MKQLTNDDIINQLIERPTPLEINKRAYLITPASMGKTFLMARLIAELRINEKALKENAHAEILRLIKKKKAIVLRLLAYLLSVNKYELFNENEIKNKIAEIDTLDDAQKACLIEYALSIPQMADFSHALGIDKEQDRIKDIQAIKENDKGSVPAGGVSLYGSIIDAACERYGWPYDYVVWGISYTNLQLMLADAPRTIYLNDKERKMAGALIDNDRVSGDSAEGMNRLKELINKK